MPAGTDRSPRRVESRGVDPARRGPRATSPWHDRIGRPPLGPPGRHPRSRQLPGGRSAEASRGYLVACAPAPGCAVLARGAAGRGRGRRPRAACALAPTQRSRARSRYLRAAAPRAPHSATRAHLPFVAAKELAPHSFPFYQSPVSHPRCPPGPAHPNAQSPGRPLRAPPNGRRKPGAHTHPWLRSGKLGDLANLDTHTLLEH